ncbi:MAG: hypothetical protein PHW69_04265 [Elusimicrobiaceae bacterium]|nr:hypothetical protein [Elusimicrobiaceae bacterium]
MKNNEIADILREMSLLLELDGANLFSIDEWRRAARIAGSSEVSLCGLAPARLAEIRGLSPLVAGSIAEICRSGVCDPLAALRSKYPYGICSLLKIHGIGPGRAKQLYYNLGIKSPEELKEALVSGALNGADGFGPNALRAIAQGLSLRLKSEGRLLWFHAWELAGKAADFAVRCGAARAVVCGGVRAGLESVEKIVLAITAAEPEKVFSRFSDFEETALLPDQLQTRRLYRLKGEIDCELVLAPPAALPFVTLFETGSAQHLAGLKKIAGGRGLELGPNGLRRCPDRAEVACGSEEDIYAALGLEFVPPELRAGAGELELASRRALPQLLTRADILGEFHNHTLFSDGSCPLESMLARAAAERYSWVFLGDHSREVRVTRGLDYDGFLETKAALALAARQFPGLRAARSLEVEIYNDGRIEFSPDQLKNIPFAVASVHSGFEMDPERMTQRLVRAAGAQGVDAIAHPTGRIIGRRPGYSFDFDCVASACVAHGTALEINAQPDRQDLCPEQVRAAKKLGCRFIISTDAHSSHDLRFIMQGVTIARRAGLTRSDVLNTLAFDEISVVTGKTA